MSKRCNNLHKIESGITYQCLRLKGHEGKHKHVGITWENEETMTEYGVYEDATGVLWKVTPATKENARREAALVGEGHRVMKVKLGKQLEAAFEAGRVWERGENRG